MKNDIAYANADFIPGSGDTIDQWIDDARAHREVEAAVGRARLNVAYGQGARQQLDLFHPAGLAEGLVVFVHGGYWLRFDRSYWSHFAAGLTARGWAVAMPSYTLAPEARIAEMSHEVAAAITHAATLIRGPIRLAGHSAGGHLVAQVTSQNLLAPEVTARLEKIVPISPVGDLRPLLETSMNETLQLDAAQAKAESPTLHDAPDCPVSVWVGAQERPVFIDQAHDLAAAWSAEYKIASGRHHFDIIDELRMDDSPLVDTILA